jgi:IS4 transposase
VSGTGTEDFGDNRIEIDFSETVHIDGPIEVFLKGQLPFYSEPDITLVAAMLRFSGDIPDDRAEWHHNYTPIESWMSAHILRKVNGWTIQKTAERIRGERDMPQMLGFFEDEPKKGARGDPPSYTQLRDVWEETFTDRHRGAVIVIAERLVDYCRENGFPAPEDVFLPEEDVEVEEPTEDHPTVRDLTIEKTADVWEHARPMVLRHWHLKRHHNWQIPEANFFDGHAYLATSSDDVFPESGLGNMMAKSGHERVQYASTHRRELKKFTIEEIRELHQSVTRDLIKEARREGELVGKMKVAIDQTKGHPWTGHVERDEDGNNLEPWILGYKNDNDKRPQQYFQWASVQVVGLDVPLILDAIPVRRGMTKGEIVDELMETANELLHDPEIVMMDAGFDSEASKNSAEKHGTYYLNRGSRDTDDKKRMREMWENRETVRIVEEEDRPGMPTRKTIYVPHILADEEKEDDDDGPSELRQQLLSDFEEAGGDDLPDQSPFDSLMDDIREEEEEQGLSEDDIDGAEQYVVFETNHPLANKRGGRNRDTIPEEEQIHAAARMVRNYGNRWGIENGYKKVGHFLPRSGSKDPVLRFFGFMFACTLCNCWRLVDLLVKLSVEDDPDYTPLVTASRFLAVAEGMFGLGSKPPPD